MYFCKLVADGLLFAALILMMDLMKKKYFILTTLILSVLIFLLNYNYPLTADDCIYARMNDGSHIGGFLDIIKFQYHHYFTWGEPWASIVNSAAYVVFVCIIYKISDFEGNQQIIEQKRMGVKDIMIQGTFDKDHSRLVVTNLGDALSTTIVDVNKFLAKYHGVNSVTVIDLNKKTDEQ